MTRGVALWAALRVSDERIATCRCGASILIAVTSSGYPLPVEATPDPDGEWGLWWQDDWLRCALRPGHTTDVTWARQGLAPATASPHRAHRHDGWTFNGKTWEPPAG
jgi:hypothetical protein